MLVCLLGRPQSPSAPPATKAGAWDVRAQLAVCTVHHFCKRRDACLLPQQQRSASSLFPHHLAVFFFPHPSPSPRRPPPPPLLVPEVPVRSSVTEVARVSALESGR